jgi:hypothetical protein
MMIASLLLAAALGVGGQVTAPPGLVNLDLRDNGIAVPARLTAGLTAFHVENKGSESHDVRIVELKDKHTLDDLSAWLKAGGQIPAWLRTAGGAGAIAPGGAEDYFVTLAPGSYVALCGQRGDDGVTHAEKGAFAPFTVVDGKSALRPPAADRVVMLRDHGFQLTAPVEGGRSTWQVRNTGSEPHQMLIVKLADSGGEYPERAWFNHGARGPRPGQAAGGVLEVPPGEEAWLRVELGPGSYLLVCAEQEEDGQHFDLGMIYRFTIE